MIEDFCYATLQTMGLPGEIAIQYGQAIIIGAGMVFGTALALRYRFKTRDKRYLRDGE